MIDYYAFLGVERNAALKEIKTAYKQKALIFHPDRPTGSETLFKLLDEAYKTLSDLTSRQIYDREIIPRLAILQTNFSEAITRYNNPQYPSRQASSQQDRDQPYEQQQRSNNTSYTFQSTFSRMRNNTQFNGRQTPTPSSKQSATTFEEQIKKSILICDLNKFCQLMSTQPTFIPKNFRTSLGNDYHLNALQILCLSSYKSFDNQLKFIKYLVEQLKFPVDVRCLALTLKDYNGKLNLRNAKENMHILTNYFLENLNPTQQWPTEANKQFFYSLYVNTKLYDDVLITIFHLKDFKITNEDFRIRGVRRFALHAISEGEYLGLDEIDCKSYEMLIDNELSSEDDLFSTAKLQHVLEIIKIAKAAGKPLRKQILEDKLKMVNHLISMNGAVYTLRKECLTLLEDDQASCMTTPLRMRGSIGA